MNVLILCIRHTKNRSHKKVEDGKIDKNKKNTGNALPRATGVRHEDSMKQGDSVDIIIRNDRIIIALDID